ncbi:MAG: MFS transporter [Hyphomicrobiales bacterium]|nr:MFS transporter [Hyphomicrobiales bacterium]
MLASIHVPGAVLIAAGIGASLEATQLSVAVYLAVYAASQVTVVIVTGIRRPVNVILAGCAIAGLGTAVCAAAPGIVPFYAGRVLQAVGASLCVLSIRVLVRLVHTPPAASALLASLFAVTSAGLLLGPMAAGYLMETLGWRAIFAVCAGWGAVNLATLWLAVAGHPHWRGESRPAASGGANLRNFYDCLTSGRLLLYVAFNTALYWGFYGFVTGLPIVAAAMGITDAKTVGLISASTGVGAICGGLAAARLARTLPANGIIGLGLLSTLLPALLLATPWRGGGAAAVLALGGVGLGAGWVLGLVQPNALLSAMSVPGTEPAAAAALIGCTQILGGACASFAVPFAGDSFAGFVLILGAAGWAALAAWLAAGRRPAGP